MTMALRAAVQATWDKALDEDRTASVPAVAERVIADYPELYAQEVERLGRTALVRWIKDLARVATEDDGQLTLFGLPAIIAVPGADGEYAYLRTAKAVWDDVQAGRHIREANVARAQVRLDQYDEGIAMLRPVMEGTTMTVAEAVWTLSPARDGA